MNLDVTERDLQILKIILGEKVIEEFLKYLDEKERKHYIDTINKPIKNEKKYIVDVSKFDADDLIGYWDYDDCYIDDRAYVEPKWFKALDLKCYVNPNQQYVVVFTGVKNADDEVYKLLEKLNKTGKLTDKFKLPKNARYSITKLPPRKTPQKEHKHEEYSGGGDNPFDYTDYDVLK